jgi:uncharacterized protein (TIGR02145 family)
MQRILIAALLLLSWTLQGQAPQLIPFQAIARDAAGQPLSSTTVNARFTIHEGSALGPNIWQELQTVSTSSLGLFTVQLGSNVSLGNLNWADGSKFMQVEIDLGNGFVDIGTQQMLSVPYALYAENSGSSIPGPQGPAGTNGANGTNGQNSLVKTTTEPAGANCATGGVKLQYGLDANSNGILDIGEINSTLTKYVCNGASGPQGPAGNGFNNGTATNQIMYWNGSAWTTLNSGTNGQVLAVCGSNLTWVTLDGVCAPLLPTYPAGTVHCNPSNPTAIVDVTNPITGRTWMDRNLGASQVATSSTDINSYGSFYQWGRRSDGHQCRTSGSTDVISSVDQPNNALHIMCNGVNITNDWRNPQNSNLWQGVSGINNPCPSGYRIPTEQEFNEEIATWSSLNSTGAFQSVLKLPLGGMRGYTDGSGDPILNVGTQGLYWTSTTFNDPLNNYEKSGFLLITSTLANVNSTYSGGSRARGFCVRCIKE